MDDVVGRLAPSPSGQMHLGNAFSALVAWLAARSVGGEVRLRLEDLDKQRCPREYGFEVMEAFRWMGLSWDGEAVWQSQRDDWYDQCMKVLEAKHLIYPCYCSRTQRLARQGPTEASAPHGPTPVYDGTCRAYTSQQRLQLAGEGRIPAQRLAVPSTVPGGDPIVRRSDGLYAYQLAVVADDGEMGINQVVRGRDLLPSTPQQIWLHTVLGYQPPQYHHLPLLLAPDGRRLSKREGDLTLATLAKTFTAPQLVGKLAAWGGLVTEDVPCTPQALIPYFSWDKLVGDDIMLPSSFYDGR